MKHILILLFIVPMAVCSQHSTDESHSSWNAVIVDYSINNNFYLKNETHFRKTNFLKDWQQFLIRPSLHYKYTQNVDFSVGYSFIKSYREAYNFNENNVWQQVLLSHASGASKFKHRFRFEQRFIQHITQLSNANFSADGTDFFMRFRYRFTWQAPLFKIADTKSLNAVAFDEIWLHTDKGIVPKALNQNWFYLGLSYQIFKNTNLGIGYMSAYAPVHTDNFNSNHILQTTLKYHIK